MPHFDNVEKVFIGNPEGVQSKKSRKIVSQKSSRWNFGKHLEYLKYKLAAVGIALEEISESYSTQTCPVCGRRRKCKNRIYRCECSVEMDRYLNAAINLKNLSVASRKVTTVECCTSVSS